MVRIFQDATINIISTLVTKILGFSMFTAETSSVYIESMNFHLCNDKHDINENSLI